MRESTRPSPDRGTGHTPFQADTPDMRVSRRLLLGVFLLPGLALALPSLAHSHPRAHTLVLDGAGGGVDPPLVSGSAGQGPARSTAGAGATDGIRLAVLPATFVDDERVPLTRRQLRQRIFGPGVSVAGFYARASSGAMELTGDVLDPITVPLRADACDPTGWADAARAVVGDAALAAYSHLLLVVPGVEACPWAGLAQVGGNTAWINGEPTRGAIAHELGHLLGLGHAGSLRCTGQGGRAPLGESCRLDSEYGDPFSLMGGQAPLAMNGIHRAQLGWLDADRSATIAISGTYSLVAVHAPTPGIELIRIPLGTTSLTLELVRATGRDDRGVVARVDDPSAPASRSRLLDGSPATASFGDAPLGVGARVDDPITGVGVRVDAVGAAGAIVSVSLPGDEGGGAPSAPTGLAVPGAAGGRAVLRWSAAPGATSYVVEAAGRVLGVTSTPRVVVDWPTGARRLRLTVRSVDGAGRAGPRSEPLVARRRDASAPTRPRGLRGSTRDAVVRLRWRAAHDDTRVRRYAVVRNGRVILRTTRRSVRVRSLRGVAQVFRVVAIDGAGNRSRPSRSVVVGTGL